MPLTFPIVGLRAPLPMADRLLDADAPLPGGSLVPILRRLLVFLRPHRMALMASIVLAVAAQAFAIAVPWLTGDVIDDAIVPKDRERLIQILALLLIAAVLRFGLMVARRLVAGRMAVDLEYEIRNALYSHLLRLPFAFHDRHQTGQLMSRATSDVGMVRIFLAYGLLFLTQYVIAIVAVLAALFLTNVPLALVVLATTPTIGLVAWRYSRVAQPVTVRAQQAVADLTARSEESVSGVRVVKAFGQEQAEIARFSAASTELVGRNMAATRLRARYVPILEFLPSISVAAVLLIGGSMVIADDLTLGSFVRFNLLLVMLVMPLRALGMWMGQAQRAAASGRRVLELLDVETTLVDTADPVPLPDGRGAIRFSDVSFGYEPGEPVLTGVSLEITAGETVALIGPTGSGKTTLASLVPRFYDPTAGTVSLDGLDVRNASLDDIRRSVAVVAEETFLFSTTVRDNIAFGRPDATFEEVVHAARRAEADAFIRSLPDGYDTVVGERGLTLSGGQRQRISIARALLCDPRVLILDDATASVDATTESRIRRALAEVMQNRTTIVIAHRLSTLALAERVIALDRGRVVADGRPDELRRTSALYRAIEEQGLVDQSFVSCDPDEYVAPKEGAGLAGSVAAG